MSISLRDTPVELLTYGGSATNGWKTDSWSVGSTVWGRLEQPGGLKRYAQGGLAESQIDAVVALDDSVTVDTNGLVRLGGVGGTIFKILTVLPRRRLREIHVPLVRADKQQYPGL